MIRIVLIGIFLFFFLVLFSPALVVEWIIGKFDPKKKSKSSLWLVQRAFGAILWLAGTRIEVIGRENIPDDRPVLYVGNHRSFFDIVIGYRLIKGEAGFVAKKEMEKIWFLSNWMKNLHCLFLDRDNIKEGLKTILTGIDYVKKGISIWIFPEGTRNKGKGVLEFKEGSMKIAEKAGCPIIPVAMTGTAEIFENHFPWVKKSHVTVTFGEPIEIKNLEKEQKKFLGAYTRQIILSMLPDDYKE
ncbi:lysophospholipid acyltransferase family protein [Qiania dongpingensis]|uniref:1-acyl-sn-glycerol-3-phosphate acyltransferase n=1 Tax=Qiania dongpingensis TaxID=2763669 RepID=A0A7G9G0H6_9FIRM|nr:lysophospholipid acyltransferase family protein [Qiania dongpingensis]QNM04308.1 1-acyl-sn-glycerol-3-phosphate acyltransferase [Qiania dongpingensis]